MNRFSRPCLAAIVLLAIVAAAPAAEIYVSAAASGAELGTQQSPFRTVQAAVNAAAAGDIVRVAAGTYTENVRVQGKAIVLEGGYSAGWIREVAANVTTLVGAGGDAVVNLIESDATLDGFRITGGTGSTEDLPYSRHGGGIYSRDGSPTITNCTIENNDIRNTEPPSENNYGGGIYVSNAPLATITNNLVRANFAGRGAGIAVIGPAAVIRGNTVEQNVGVSDHGGGLYIGVTNALITQNVIRRNEIGRELGYGWGGGLIFFNPGNSAEISFNVVYENFAAGYGAGEFIDEGATANIHHELIFRNLTKAGCEAVSAIAVDGGDGVGSRATIDHCTVVSNVCETVIRGNGLQVEGKSEATVTNSIFWNNGGDDFAVDGTSKLTVKFTDSEEAIAGEGNISADPMFVNMALDDYHLAPGSPCIDAADPAAPFDSEPAPNGGRADMGRYGNASDTPPTQTLPSTPPSSGTDPGTGGSGAGSGSGGSGSGAGGYQNETDPASAFEDLAGGALCPSSAAMLLSLSLFGGKRLGRRKRTA